MTKKDNLKKEIQYQKIGNVYYPKFDDAYPSLGFYAKEHLNYLKENYPRKYFNLIKNKQYKNRLFILNCFCEQLFQSKMEEIFLKYPTLNGNEIKSLSMNIKADILNEYVFQTKEVIYNGKEFKITK